MSDPHHPAADVEPSGATHPGASAAHSAAHEHRDDRLDDLERLFLVLLVEPDRGGPSLESLRVDPLVVDVTALGLLEAHPEARDRVLLASEQLVQAVLERRLRRVEARALLESGARPHPLGHDLAAPGLGLPARIAAPERRAAIEACQRLGLVDLRLLRRGLVDAAELLLREP